MPQVIRLFISSTFSDFSHERNRLQEVWKNVARYIDDRRLDIGFQIVDLRWGVAPVDFIRTETIDICLEEVRRSRNVSVHPHFMFLCGDRYGWRPFPTKISKEWRDTLLRLLTEVNQTAAVSFQSLYREDRNFFDQIAYRLIRPPTEKESAEIQTVLLAECDALPRDLTEAFLTSATHREVQLGLDHLNENPFEQALIYIRKVAGVPEQGVHLCLIDSDLANPNLRSKDAKERISAIIETLSGLENTGSQQLHLLFKTIPYEEIAKSYEGETSGEGSVSSSYSQSLDDLAQWTQARLIGLIDALPAEPGITSQAKSLAVTTQRRFIRTPWLDLLEAEISGTDRGSWSIIGKPGSGRSSAMQALRMALLEKKQEYSYLLWASRDEWQGAWSIRALLIWAISKLSEKDCGRLDTLTEIELAGCLQALLSSRTEGTVVLMIDDADLLSSETGIRMDWLPTLIQNTTRIVISLREESLCDLRRNWARCTERPLHLLSEDFLKEFFTVRLADCQSEIGGRKLQPEQLGAAIEAFHTKDLSIVELELVADNLSRLFHDEPVEIASTNPVTDFLDRLYTRHGFSAIERILQLLILSRSGLSEGELATLLWQDDVFRAEFVDRADKAHALPDALPQIVLSRLIADLQPLLRSSWGEGNAHLWFVPSPEAVREILPKTETDSKHGLARALTGLFLNNWRDESKELAHVKLSPKLRRAAHALVSAEFVGMSAEDIKAVIENDFRFVLHHCEFQKLPAFVAALQSVGHQAASAHTLAEFLVTNRETLTRYPTKAQTAPVLLQCLEESGVPVLTELARLGRRLTGLTRRLVQTNSTMDISDLAQISGEISAYAEIDRDQSIAIVCTIPERNVGQNPVPVDFIYIVETGQSAARIKASRPIPPILTPKLFTCGSLIALLAKDRTPLIYDCQTLTRVAADELLGVIAFDFIRCDEALGVLDDGGNLHLVSLSSAEHITPSISTGALLWIKRSDEHLLAARAGDRSLLLYHDGTITEISKFEEPFEASGRFERHGNKTLFITCGGEIRIITDDGHIESITPWPGAAVKAVSLQGNEDGLLLYKRDGTRLYLWPERREVVLAELATLRGHDFHSVIANISNGHGLEWATTNGTGQIMFGGSQPHNSRVQEEIINYSVKLRAFGLGPDVAKQRQFYFDVKSLAGAQFFDLHGKQQARSLRSTRTIYPAPYRESLANFGTHEAQQLRSEYSYISSCVTKTFPVPSRGCVSVDYWSGAYFWPLDNLTRASGLSLAPNMRSNIVHAEMLDPRYLLVADGLGNFVIYDTANACTLVSEDFAEGEIRRIQRLGNSSVLIEWESGAFRHWDPETARLDKPRFKHLGNAAGLIPLRSGGVLEYLTTSQERDKQQDPLVVRTTVKSVGLHHDPVNGHLPLLYSATFGDDRYLMLHAENAICAFDRRTRSLVHRTSIDAPFPTPTVVPLGEQFFALTYPGFNIWRDLTVYHAGLGRILARFVPLRDIMENYIISGSIKGARLAVEVRSASQYAAYNFDFDGVKLVPVPTPSRLKDPQLKQSDEDFWLDVLLSSEGELHELWGERDIQDERWGAHNWQHRGGVLICPTAPTQNKQNDVTHEDTEGLPALHFRRQISFPVGDQVVKWEAPLTAAILSPAINLGILEVVSETGNYLHLELRED